MKSTTPRQPMEGLTIIDMTSVVFGPYCTQILAEMGATVIKVESPEGDPMRRSGAKRNPGMGAAHLTLNRGKRSIVLDLKNEEDRQIMALLVDRADIFIHNVRAAAVERLGFAYEHVRQSNPSIIYIHCVGYGSDGPYAPLPAYDDVIQAASGAASLLPRVDGNPRPRYLPSTLADKVAGLHAVYASLGAVVHRLRTGEGQFVEVPMFEAFAHFLLEEHLAGGTFDPPRGPVGYQRQIEPHRQPFATADGYISIVPYGDANWIKLFNLMGRPDILELPDYNTPDQRVLNAETLYQRVGELTPARTTAEWIALLQPASIPAMMARNIQSIQHDPHLSATGFFRPRKHPTEGDYFEMRPPVRFGNGCEVIPAARLGQHNDEIRAELAADRRREIRGAA